MKDNVMHKVRFFFVGFMIFVTFWPFNIPFKGFLIPTIEWYSKSEKVKETANLSIDEMLDRGFSKEKIDKVREDKRLRSLAINLGLDLRGGMRLVLQGDFEDFAKKMGKSVDELTAEEKDDAMVRLIERIKGRVNKFGVSEAPIRRQGENRVLIELPGAKDPDAIKKLVMGKGNLEFRFVDEEATDEIDMQSDVYLGSFTNNSKVPKDCEQLYYYREDEYGRRQRGEPVFIKKDVIIDGDMLDFAKEGYGEFNNPIVSFDLNMKGARIFAAATRKNVGKQLAIVWDGRVISAPRIEGPIPGGSGLINGLKDMEEARSLAIILREGALPLEVNIVEQEIVGEAIGADAVAAGTNALILALVLVMIYMMVMYRASGLIANVAMITNLVLIIAVLSQLQFTLTLPGIAGLVLTVGMAVDANVIIFERIREELADDKILPEAINAGFDRAFWTILDSNLTTLIVTFILFSGAGMIQFFADIVKLLPPFNDMNFTAVVAAPVQSFAVTLFVGVLMNLFTALFVTRFIYEQIIISNLVKKRTWLFI